MRHVWKTLGRTIIIQDQRSTMTRMRREGELSSMNIVSRIIQSMSNHHHRTFLFLFLFNHRLRMFLFLLEVNHTQSLSIITLLVHSRYSVPTVMPDTLQAKNSLNLLHVHHDLACVACRAKLSSHPSYHGLLSSSSCINSVHLSPTFVSTTVLWHSPRLVSKSMIMLFKALAQAPFASMDLSITSWEVLCLEKINSLPMLSFMSLMQSMPPMFVSTEIAILILEFSESSMTCCTDAIPMLNFIRQPIKSW